MTLDRVITLGREALTTTMIIAMPCLGLSLAVGFLISVFQATTQIHDQTMTFVPKILAVMVGLFVFGGWMLRTLVDFTLRLISNLPGLI